MDTQTSENTNKNIAFYTKYRPQKFAEVLGQNQVTDILETAVKNNQISHAYLFIGSRGTGKTSVARILAREIGTSQNDLYEIDAASNNGVEQIREITESANNLPFDSVYKVYILDEVHMLSKPAFNALLKTLEEPPKHVIFILATTEPEKIPETIISRCQNFQFKTPNQSVLKEMIKKTVSAEKMKLDDSVIELIAILGDGSFRDTHTILQKVMQTEQIISDGKITLEEAEKVLGAPSNVLVNQFLEGLLTKNLESGLQTVEKIKQRNLDHKVFLKLLLMKYRVALFLKTAKSEKDLYENLVTADDLEFLTKLVEENNGMIDSRTLLRVLEINGQFLMSPDPFILFEIFLVEIISKKE